MTGRTGSTRESVFIDARVSNIDTLLGGSCRARRSDVSIRPATGATPSGFRDRPTASRSFPPHSPAVAACETARAEDGGDFVARLSSARDGAAVAAASHLVGSDQDGASWVLDAKTMPSAARHPFAAEVRDAYRGVLAVRFTESADSIGDTGPVVDNRMVFGDVNSDGHTAILYRDGNTAGGGIGDKQIRIKGAD